MVEARQGKTADVASGVAQTSMDLNLNTSNLDTC